MPRDASLAISDTVSRPWLRACVIVAMAFLFVGTVATTLLVYGPFLWHVRQPAAWQGALEAALLTALIFAALQLRRLPVPARVALLLVPVALYLRRHHVDAVLSVSLLYLEGMVLLGALFLRGLREDATRSDLWLRGLIAGVATLSLLLWMAQGFDFGTPRAQRLLAIFVLVPLLLWRWRDLQSVALLREGFRLDRPLERAWAAALIATPLVLFARSNTVFGYDELWYGLRPERVLVGEASVFESLGFVAPVYYFPKLYEVLLLPLSAMRESSAVQGVTILLGAALARLVFDMLRRLGHTRVVALAGATLAWSLPALANTSIGVKPDVFVALCVVSMVWFGWNLLQQGRRADLAWIFVCAGLAVSSKLIAFSYVGAAGLACLVGMFASKPAMRDRTGTLAGVGVLAIATAVGVFVCVRTYLLTGMPTVGPDAFVAAWRSLGMEFLPPVGTLTWTRPQVWSEVPGNVLGWIALPSEFHLRTSWPGNVWLFLPLVALLLPRGRTSDPGMPPRWLLWAVPAMGLLLFLTIRFSNRAGDGNYFIAPVVLATIAGIDLVWRRSGAVLLQQPLMLGMALFVALHAALCFVSAGWGLGTRAWDLDFTRTNRDAPTLLANRLEKAGLGGVAHWLHGQGGRTRVVGDGVLPYLGNHLPARYEAMIDIIHASGGANLTADAFLHVLACARVEAILLPVAEAEPTRYPAIAQAVAAARAQSEHRVLYRDAQWMVVSTRAMLPACAAGVVPAAGSQTVLPRTTQMPPAPSI